jgi:nucleotide-binding universal stress UspA family protein
MVNILVPTDLSDLSKVAVQYAIKIANKLDGNITLLHVINVMQATRATMRLRLNALEQELMEIAVEDLNDLVAEVSKGVKTTEPIKVKIVKGTSFNQTVKREAQKLRSGLIIMGTRGASGLRKYVLGSNTASVIEISHIPVLAVTELGDFKHFKNVVYASDLTHIERELKTLIPYFEKFDSIVHLIHIAKSLKEVSALEKKIDNVVERCGFSNVIVRVMVNKKIDEAIDHYTGVVKADLLAMFTHEASFYEKLFDRSMTRKMAFHSKVPLLAFKQRRK